MQRISCGFSDLTCQSQSLVKVMETSKGVCMHPFDIWHCVHIYIGYQCKISELEYGDLFTEVYPSVSMESKIYRC